MRAFRPGDTRQPAPDVRERLAVRSSSWPRDRATAVPSRERPSGRAAASGRRPIRTMCAASIGQIVQSLARAGPERTAQICSGIALLLFGCVPDAARASADRPPLSGDADRFGVYRAVERIAEGGMGVIFRAEDVRGGRPVAIKTARSTREADAAAIRREIVTLSGLRHPGIVRLHGYGVQPAVPWIALELLEGRTLADEISWYWPETSSGYGERRARTDERPTAPACNLRDRVGDRRAPPVSRRGRRAPRRGVLAIVAAALPRARSPASPRPRSPRRETRQRLSAQRRPHDAVRLRARLFGGRDAANSDALCRHDGVRGAGADLRRPRRSSRATSIRSAACSTSWSRGGRRFAAIHRARSPSDR